MTTTSRSITLAAPADPDGPGWRLRGACGDVDPEMFWPVANTASAQTATQKAKAVCAQCSVRDTCLQWALDTGEDMGVVGGMSARERRLIHGRPANWARQKGGRA